MSCAPVLCYLLERASSSQTCPKHTVMSICMHARWPVEEGNPVSRVEERHNTLLESASVQVTYFSSPSPIRTVLPRKLNVQLGQSINDIHKHLVGVPPTLPQLIINNVHLKGTPSSLQGCRGRLISAPACLQNSRNLVH